MVLTDLTDGLGEHVGPAGAGPARHGVTSVGPDGAVTYHPADADPGHDWFDHVLDAGGGRPVPGRVTVRVGDLGVTPGLLAGRPPGPWDRTGTAACGGVRPGPATVPSGGDGREPWQR